MLLLIKGAGSSRCKSYACGEVEGEMGSDRNGG